MNTMNDGDGAQSESSVGDGHASDLPEAREPMRKNYSSRDLFDQYKMDHGDRGHALILNNRYFQDDLLKERKGTDEDLNKMIPLLLKEFGFKKEQSLCYHDMTRQEMIDLIKNAAAKDYTNCDCFVCVILSYGTKEGDVCGYDGELINIDDLMEPLKGKEFQASKSLVGKPKIFIVQACPLEEGVQKGSKTKSDKPLTDAASDVDLEMTGMRIASEADFLIAWSSVPGSLKPRGSNFIQTLMEVGRARRATDDLLSMLTKVINKIATRYGDSDAVEVPYFRSMLRKKVFFTNPQQ